MESLSFIIILEVLASIVVISLTGVLLPGPMLTITISESARMGFIAGPLAVLGHIIPEFAIVLLLYYGFGPFLQLTIVQIIIGIIGGIALTFLGGYMLRMRPVITLEEYEGGKTYSPIIGGFITSALSPCFIIWWAVIGPALILKSTVFGLFTIPALLLTHWSIDLGWYCIVSFYVGEKRKALSTKSYRILMVICGLVIIAFGVYFLINSLTLILTPA